LIQEFPGTVALQRGDIVTALRSDILRMQGMQVAQSFVTDLGLGSLTEAFPGGSFPLGAVHEFLSPVAEGAASTAGFISGLLSTLMGDDGTVLWISAARNIFPPALRSFGIQPDRVVFVDLKKEKDVLWVMDEALKCGALSAVVGEMKDINFTESRRLQLAVEQSKSTGFILRNSARLNTTACVSRWRITPLASELIDDLPGVGFPQWRVELLRMRNGRSGVWDLKWLNERFVPAHSRVSRILPNTLDSEGEHETKKAG
jgi:protein ImuA